MKRTFSRLLCILICSFATAHANPTAQIQPLALTHVTIIDLVRGALKLPFFPNWQPVYERSSSMTKTMHRSGVKILAGTDTPNAYCFPGFGLHDELELFVKAGLTPLEALQTATVNPAQYLNLSDSLGTVEKGKLADLLLLDANPLETIGNTRKIAAVVVNGKYLPRESLDKLLSDAEAMANKN